MSEEETFMKLKKVAEIVGVPVDKALTLLLIYAKYEQEDGPSMREEMLKLLKMVETTSAEVNLPVLKVLAALQIRLGADPDPEAGLTPEERTKIGAKLDEILARLTSVEATTVMASGPRFASHFVTRFVPASDMEAGVMKLDDDELVYISTRPLSDATSRSSAPSASGPGPMITNAS
jgi:hypothetical protein